jgi:hypothetical protein
MNTPKDTVVGEAHGPTDAMSKLYVFSLHFLFDFSFLRLSMPVLPGHFFSSVSFYMQQTLASSSRFAQVKNHQSRVQQGKTAAARLHEVHVV